jgi:hypothetical protein
MSSIVVRNALMRIALLVRGCQINVWKTFIFFSFLFHFLGLKQFRIEE